MKIGPALVLYRARTGFQKLRLVHRTLKSIQFDAAVERVVCSGRQPLVAMMKHADFVKRNDLPFFPVPCAQ